MSDPERKLTEREKQRLAYVEELSSQLEEKGYGKRSVLISILRANTLGALLALLPAGGFIAWFIARYGFLVLREISLIEMLLIFLVMFLLIIVHEGIHGLTWACFCPLHMKQIEFGFIKEVLTPYCYCGAPLKRAAYLAGSLMPTLLLGFLPCLIACLLCWPAWLVLGFLMILGGAGDLLISLKLVLVKRRGQELLCLDHPTECGLILFEK